jgi:hypothetical protein
VPLFGDERPGRSAILRIDRKLLLRSHASALYMSERDQSIVPAKARVDQQSVAITKTGAVFVRRGNNPL